MNFRHKLLLKYVVKINFIKIKFKINFIKIIKIIYVIYNKMYFNFITILIILIILIVIIILYFIVRKRHLTTFTTTFTTFIPTKKKNGQNKKENFLVYDYNLNEGGFADFLKYFFKTFYISDILNKQLYINFNHPSKKFILFNLPNYQNENKNTAEYLSIRKGDFITILSENKNFIIKNMDFYKSNKKLNKNNIPDDKNTIKYIIDKYKNLNNILYYGEEVINVYNKLKPKKEYISIHYRIGDKSLEITPDQNIAKNDDREVDDNKIILNIKNIVENSKEKDIYFFCDNSNFKKKITPLFPKIKTLDFDIIHFGLKYSNIDKETYEKNLILTIVEFLIIQNSLEIHKMSLSGVSEIAAYLNDNDTINPKNLISYFKNAY